MIPKGLRRVHLIGKGKGAPFSERVVSKRRAKATLSAVAQRSRPRDRATAALSPSHAAMPGSLITVRISG